MANLTICHLYHGKRSKTEPFGSPTAGMNSAKPVAAMRTKQLATGPIFSDEFRPLRKILLETIAAAEVFAVPVEYRADLEVLPIHVQPVSRPVGQEPVLCVP